PRGAGGACESVSSAKSFEASTLADGERAVGLLANSQSFPLVETRPNVLSRKCPFVPAAARARILAIHTSGARMYGLYSFAKTFDEKSGWGRVGVLLSIAIIAVAAVVLYHTLRDINVQEVIDAVQAVEKHDVARAALFVAAGYFTLTFYDLFALRSIGHAEVP